MTAPAGDVELDEAGRRDRALVAFLISTGARIDTYLDARTDPGAALFVSYSPGRPGRRLSERGAEASCTRLGAANQITELHPHRFRHTAGTLVQDELGDPLVTADYLGHHRLGSVAGYAEVSTHRREEANEALQRRGLSTWQPHGSRLRPTSREPALNDPMRFGRRREVIYVEERGAPYLTLPIGVVPNFTPVHGLADDGIVGALAAAVFTMLVSANA